MRALLKIIGWGLKLAHSRHTKISDEYIAKIRCLRTPLSRFAYKMTHIRISGEYVIKKL